MGHNSENKKKRGGGGQLFLCATRCPYLMHIPINLYNICLTVAQIWSVQELTDGQRHANRIPYSAL